MGLFSREKRIGGGGFRFLPERLEESIEERTCPGCGLFHMFTLQAEEEPELEKLSWCMDYPLVLVFFQIGAYRKKPLDTEALGRLEKVLSALHKAGKEIILRIAYDNAGQGLAHEPETFEQIQEHVEQLRGVLEKYSEDIYLFQGLLVGSWGEMHTSRYLGTDRLMKLSEQLRDILGPRPYFAFRRPMQYRRLYEKVTRRARTGLFDDGILGSDNDLGTFGNQPGKEAGWGNPWEKEEELAFIGELARYAPVGGETVLGGDYRLYPYSLEQTEELLRKLHISYLNSDYDRRVYQAWEELVCEKKGPWRGVNGRDYLLRHIGYRLRVSKLDCRWRAGVLTLDITVTNDGFSRAYREIVPYLRSGRREWTLDGDLSKTEPGKEIVVHKELADAEMAESVVFGARTERGDAVPFANAATVGSEAVLGEIVRS